MPMQKTKPKKAPTIERASNYCNLLDIWAYESNYHLAPNPCMLLFSFYWAGYQSFRAWNPNKRRNLI